VWSETYEKGINAEEAFSVQLSAFSDQLSAPEEHGEQADRLKLNADS
jgi:hypothetical protein